jgi:hypothetical protein
MTAIGLVTMTKQATKTAVQTVPATIVIRSVRRPALPQSLPGQTVVRFVSLAR